MNDNIYGFHVFGVVDIKYGKYSLMPIENLLILSKVKTSDGSAKGKTY